MRLSLAMIVKNEARFLAHCLESVQGLVDEAVVVDTGSEDATPEIARSKGAQVSHFPWCGDFSAARNAALARCRGDWILVLDADEAIDRKDHAAIRQALERTGIHGWMLPIRNHLRSGAYAGAGGEAKPNDGRYLEGAGFSHYVETLHLRLFRAQGGPVYAGRIHELAEPYFEARGLALGRLDAAIHHYGKNEGARERAKLAEYLRLALLDAAERPGESQLQYNVVQQAILAEAWPEALEAARRFRALEARRPLLVELGGAKALRALGRAGEALAWLDGVQAEGPALACERAEALLAAKRPEEGERELLVLLERAPFYTRAFLALAGHLAAQDRREAALQVLEAGLDQNPKDELLWNELVVLGGQGDPRAAARNAWDALQAVPGGGQGLWHQIVFRVLLAQGDRAEAAEVLRRGLAAFPGNQELEALQARL